MGKFSESVFAAWLQMIVSYRRQESGLYREIAERLPLGKVGRVLDIGTGTGLQLRAVHDLHPEAELFGLDLSPRAIRAARKALQDLKVDLRSGSIAAAPYEDGFFDLVTCNASMSYWEDPAECLNEIFRILKPGGEAVLFEPHRDIDIQDALERIRQIMADKGPLRRWGAVQLNKFGLQRSGGIGMKLYSRAELIDLARTSSFEDNCSVELTSLLDIPIFVCIHLWKPV